jgi:hypothetical protein
MVGNTKLLKKNTMRFPAYLIANDVPQISHDNGPTDYKIDAG